MHTKEPSAWRYETREAFLARLTKGQHPSDGKWWVLEPSVAADLLQQLMNDAELDVRTNHRLIKVVKEGGRIASIECDNGAAFVGRVFIDATYEGDLMAKAGVSFRVGRESSAEYGEPLAGVVPRKFSTRNQINVDIDPYDSEGRLIYGVQSVE